MTLADYPNRFLLAAILSSLLVFGLCGTLALFLAREQSRTADVLAENIGSRRVAANLEEALGALVALQKRGVNDVTPIHERVEGHLADAEKLADKSQEQEFVRRISESYRQYLSNWAEARDPSRPKTELVRHLQNDTLAACKRLQEFNATQVDESEREHRASLGRMTWGLAVVGGLGSLAGLVLGYGLARGLRRTIQQFLVQVQGAADLFGPESARVEWQRNGESLGEGANELFNRVKQAVVRLQQREREVRRAERLAALGQLAAGVAHEVRNPLTSALLLLQMARKDPSSGGLTDEDQDLIERELQRIDQFLQTFLDFARPPQMARTACNLDDVVRDALALTRGRIEQQKIAVNLDAPTGGCRLDADPDQLRQVVLNLILNALDAMPHGGQIRVTLLITDHDLAELTVTDSGTGIPAPILEKLFEPFTTGKETGLGLGLVVSKRIVEDHSGTIHGSNNPEGGARFVVRLPMRKAEVDISGDQSHADFTSD